MGESKHTPGPWVFEDYSQEEPEFFVVPATYFGTVAKTGNEADARLIAAAPELLAALKAMQAYAIAEIQRGGAHHDPVWAQVADAIAKAEGRS